MKDNITYGICGSIMAVCGITQTSELFQLIQVIIGVISALFAIAYTIYKWYNKAKEDGKITKEEVKDLIDDLQDTLQDKEKGDK